MSKDIETKILAARTALMWGHPFFATLCLQLVLIEELNPAIVDTMATDGRSLWYHPPFVEKLSREELTFVLAHEVMHNANLHHTRRQGRDPHRWNVAADHAINLELKAYAEEDQKAKGLKKPTLVMPKDGLADPQYAGLGAEEIYARLPEDDGAGGGTGQMDPGGCGGVRDAAGPGDDAGLARAEAEMTVQVRQAASIAKAQNAGQLPGALQRLVDKLLAAKVDWRKVFRRFIDESMTRDYSWARPNRRFLRMGFILPSLISDGVSHIVFAVDTSGSITEEALNAFAAEINGAFGDGAIDKVTVVYADAHVQGVDVFEQGDVVDLRMLGGGGTRFSPVMEWVLENASDARALVYLTDMECHDFGEAPDCPVLWAVDCDPRSFGKLTERAPFGEAIRLAI